jgi:hypothetical protein
VASAAPTCSDVQEPSTMSVAGPTTEDELAGDNERMTQGSGSTN